MWRYGRRTWGSVREGKMRRRKKKVTFKRRDDEEKRRKRRQKEEGEGEMELQNRWGGGKDDM